jgi:hypothetical protein
MSKSLMPLAAFLQEQPLWCWAASAEVVLRCLNKLNDETAQPCFYNQCSLARRIVASEQECCPVLNNPDEICPYDTDLEVEKIIGLYTKLNIGLTFKIGPLELDEIIQEIDNGCPVEILFAYGNAIGGHAAVIFGYDDEIEETPVLIVNDPLNGWDWGSVRYDKLKAFYYMGQGTWAATLYKFTI